MAKKRDKLEVIYDMLRIIKDKHNSIKPTPLLRFSNLSTQRFQEYIKELLEKELVLEIKDKKNKRFYSLSEKGFKYLERYSTIKEFIFDFGL